jgi:carbon-monoxide dehydrogenase medium subunit
MPSYMPADPDELLTAVEFPRRPAHVAFGEACRKHNDFPIVSVAVTGERDEQGRWSSVEIALGGVADSPVIATAAGKLLEHSDLGAEHVAAAGAAAIEVIDPPSDIRASADYRRHLTPIYVRRVLTELKNVGLRAASSRPMADDKDETTDSKGGDAS